jgi:uncharacterized protein (DUF1786 family)
MGRLLYLFDIKNRIVAILAHNAYFIFTSKLSRVLRKINEGKLVFVLFSRRLIVSEEVCSLNL